MRRGRESRQISLLCMVDEAGSLLASDPEPFRVGFLLTARPNRLESDIRTLKRELPPRGKSGEFHAREDHPDIRAMLRRLLCLNDEPRMHIVEWIKGDFSAAYFVKGRLTVVRDANLLVASFAITASEIAAVASAQGYSLVDVVVEAAKGDIRSEHRSREQAFSRVLRIAFEKQAMVKRPPAGTQTIIRVSTRRKHEYPPLSFVDYWLWAYCRATDRGDSEVFPDELRNRTSIRCMTENDVKPLEIRV